VNYHLLKKGGFDSVKDEIKAIFEKGHKGKCINICGT
jgi:hypothetical protein